VEQAVSESVHLLSVTMPMPVMPAVVFEPFEPAVPEPVPTLPPMPSKADVRRVEDWMLEQPQVKLEAFNHFAPGLYMREGRAPAHAIVTGREHRTEHFSILAHGKITVWTEQGMATFEAPAIIRSLPGAKRIAYTHTDVVWITVHANPTDETDEDALVKMLTFPEPREMDAAEIESVMQEFAALCSVTDQLGTQP
jgi:hypothetical protein